MAKTLDARDSRQLSQSSFLIYYLISFQHHPEFLLHILCSFPFLFYLWMRRKLFVHPLLSYNFTSCWHYPSSLFRFLTSWWRITLLYNMQLCIQVLWYPAARFISLLTTVIHLTALTSLHTPLLFPQVQVFLISPKLFHCSIKSSQTKGVTQEMEGYDWLWWNANVHSLWLSWPSAIPMLQHPLNACFLFYPVMSSYQIQSLFPQSPENHSITENRMYYQEYSNNGP